MNAQLFFQDTNQTGEGATWLPKQSQFLWVDIEGQTLKWYNALTKTFDSHPLDQMVSSIVPFGEESVLLFLQNRIIQFNLLTREEKLLLPLSLGEGNRRPNDVKASPDGRLFMGVMHLSEYEGNGALYRIDGDLSVHQVLDRQSIPNGIVWDLNKGAMYYVDSFRKCIEKYAYDPRTGEIDCCGIAVKVPNEFGVPDGMTIDQNGNLWVAHWGGFGVYVWNPENGELLDKIEVPVPNVASCTFDDQGGLYITTARAGLSETELERYPLSGSVFYAKTIAKSAQNHYPFIQEGRSV